MELFSHMVAKYFHCSLLVSFDSHILNSSCFLIVSRATRDQPEAEVRVTPHRLTRRRYCMRPPQTGRLWRKRASLKYTSRMLLPRLKRSPPRPRRLHHRFHRYRTQSNWQCLQGIKHHRVPQEVHMICPQIPMVYPMVCLTVPMICRPAKEVYPNLGKILTLLMVPLTQIKLTKYQLITQIRMLVIETDRGNHMITHVTTGGVGHNLRLTGNLLIILITGEVDHRKHVTIPT